MHDLPYVLGNGKAIIQNVTRIFGPHAFGRALVMSEDEKTAGISDGRSRPTALTVERVAKILSTTGRRRITEEMIRIDIDIDAPTNPDGTVNLVHYTAWLVKEMAGAD